MNRNEKGQISPAQSRIARQMRGSTPLGERTMTQKADKIGYGGQTHGTHRYGETLVGTGGMHRMAQLKKANPNKAAKSRVVLRGQKDAYRKSYTKVGARMHKKGLLKAPDAAQ